MGQITTLVGPYFYVLIPKSIPSGVYVLIFHLAKAPSDPSNCFGRLVWVHIRLAECEGKRPMQVQILG
jgi:hypothetical protein